MLDFVGGRDACAGSGGGFDGGRAIVCIVADAFAPRFGGFAGGGGADTRVAGTAEGIADGTAEGTPEGAADADAAVDAPDADGGAADGGLDPRAICAAGMPVFDGRIGAGTG